MEEAPLHRPTKPKTSKTISFSVPLAPPPKHQQQHVLVEEIKEEEPYPEPDYNSDDGSNPVFEPPTRSFPIPDQPAMQQRAFSKMEDEYSRAARIFPERFSPQRDEQAADATRQELIARSRGTKQPTTYSDYLRYGLYAAAVAAFGFLAYKGMSQARARHAYEDALAEEARTRQQTRDEADE